MEWQKPSGEGAQYGNGAGMQSNCVESTRHSLKSKKKERAEKGGVGIRNRGTVGNAGTVMSPSPTAHPTTCAKTVTHTYRT